MSDAFQPNPGSLSSVKGINSDVENALRTFAEQFAGNGIAESLLACLGLMMVSLPFRELLQDVGEADKTSTVQYKAQFPCTVLGVQFGCDEKTADSGTCDLKNVGAVSVLSAAVTLTANTTTNATLAAPGYVNLAVGDVLNASCVLVGQDTELISGAFVSMILQRR